MCAAAELSRGRTIALGGVIVRFLSMFGTLEERSANDRPRAVIVRSYRTDPVKLNVKLEQKIRLLKIENNKKKTKQKLKIKLNVIPKN
jgi:hypothetical protein